MPLFKVKVTQAVVRIRSTVIEVEADTHDEAVEMVGEGEVSLPSDDSAWTIERDTLREDAELG